MTLNLIITILFGGALAATVITFVMGLFNMVKAGPEADKRSNRMMRLRILFQALAIILFSLLLFLRAK